MNAADRLELLILQQELDAKDSALLRNVAALVRSLTPIASLTGKKYCEICVCSLESDSEGHEDDCLLKKLEDIAAQEQP